MDLKKLDLQRNTVTAAACNLFCAAIPSGETKAALGIFIVKSIRDELSNFLYAAQHGATEEAFLCTQACYEILMLSSETAQSRK